MRCPVELLINVKEMRDDDGEPMVTTAEQVNANFAEVLETFKIDVPSHRSKLKNSANKFSKHLSTFLVKLIC